MRSSHFIKSWLTWWLIREAAMNYGPSRSRLGEAPGWGSSWRAWGAAPGGWGSSWHMNRHLNRHLNRVWQRTKIFGQEFKPMVAMMGVGIRSIIHQVL